MRLPLVNLAQLVERAAGLPVTENLAFLGDKIYIGRYFFKTDPAPPIKQLPSC